jgi:hypothetical protein
MQLLGIASARHWCLLLSPSQIELNDYTAQPMMNREAPIQQHITLHVVFCIHHQLALVM